MDGELRRLVKNGAIKKVPYKPRCVLALWAVPKKSGKLRLVVDCQPINSQMDVPSFNQEGVSVVAELIQQELPL